MRLQSAVASCGVVKHEADEGFAVVNFVGGYQGEGLGELEPEDLDVFVRFGSGDTLADVTRQIDLHPFTEEARACEVFCEHGPAFGAIASLFNELAFGGGECCFAGFDAACG